MAVINSVTREDLWVKLSQLVQKVDTKTEKVIRDFFLNKKEFDIEKLQQRANRYDNENREIKTQIDQLLKLQENAEYDELYSLNTHLANKIKGVFDFINPRIQNSAPTAPHLPAPVQKTPEIVSFKIFRASAAATQTQAPTAPTQILQQMSTLFRNGGENDAIKLFSSLPGKEKASLQEALWRSRGKPNTYAGDFGRDSMLNTDRNVSHYSNPQQKAAAVELCLVAEMNETNREKFDRAQKIVAGVQSAWQGIDATSKKGSEKNAEKRESLFSFAKEIAPLFSKETVKVPQADGKSCLAMAEAYIKAYPCLRPFILQLVPDLRISGDVPSTSITETPKSSQSNNPNLGQMDDRGRKTYRTNIVNETLQTAYQGYYINSKGEKIELTLQPSINSLELFTSKTKTVQSNHPVKTKLILDRADCLTVARDCAGRGLSPIVLDAASNGHFGGGYKTGAGAQEENLCRRSALGIAADPTQRFQDNDFYPLTENGPGAALYVDHVPVFRGEEIQGYPYLDVPFECAFAITAADNFNEAHQMKNHGKILFKLDEVNGELRLPSPKASETKEKLRSVLTMAEFHSHKSVVLMPIGAGAFCNPPKHICELMMELITQEFPHSFEEVHISIIDDHNTGKAHNKEGNYAAFEKTIEGSFNKQMKNAGIAYSKSSV